MKTRAPLAFFAAVVPLVHGAACRPDFDERESFVDRTMVIGVRIEPAEAKPGEAITASLLVASPEGVVASPATRFGFCTTPKLLTENGSVSAACQRGDVAPIGDALGTIGSVMPAEACFVFGPEVKAAELRPRDPDSTGGFFQPIRAEISGGVVAFGFARVKCNLANVSADAATAFSAQYRLNVNPTLLPLEARVNGALVALDAIPRGAEVAVRAAWRPEDAEAYVALDPSTQLVVARRETMRVSWYATAGSFTSDRTGRGEAEPETFTDNTWTAPSEPRRAHLFAVLRDARGGTAFATISVDVR
ncbi:MAG: hypothetical protein JST00_13780 [Deltaproteobacteria bacterium]|nr:hypothetical protein [Deltaproteobacteria bacterium]